MHSDKGGQKRTENSLLLLIIFYSFYVKIFNIISEPQGIVQNNKAVHDPFKPFDGPDISRLSLWDSCTIWGRLCTCKNKKNIFL